MDSTANTAGLWLNNAERDLQEGAYAPFWDDIENVVLNLHEFEGHLRKLLKIHKSYNMELTLSDGLPPPFSVRIDALPDVGPIHDKMHMLIREAQRNFQFATIYEQRRTNKILTAGFSTLEEAINNIDYTLDELREDFQQESQVRREHELKAEEMLDNIQRHRKPNV